MEGAICPVIRYVDCRNHLFGVIECSECLVLLTFFDKLSYELREDTAVRVAHTHHVLVDVDTRLVDAAELELVHQVVVHLFTVDLAVQLVRIERSEAVGETLLCEVVAHAQMVFASYGDCHIDRTFPVSVGKHFEHHQLTLVEGAFRVAVGVSKGDCHVFGDGVAQRFRYFHAGAAYGFLIYLHDDAVRRDERKLYLFSCLLEKFFQLVVLAKHPAVDDFLQFIRILTEDGVNERQYGSVSLCSQFVCLFEIAVDKSFHFRTDRDIFVLSFHVFHTVPSDRE